MRARTWRQLLVWLHVVSSVSWLGQAVALAVLLFTAAAPGPQRIGAAEAAQLLDATVLLYSANVAGATGFLLSATTSWGFFRHHWVTAKFVMTVGALYAAVAVVPTRMETAVASVRAGGSAEAALLATVVAVMATAFVLQAWLSVAKPGGSTRHGRLAPAPAWVVAAAVVAPPADVALGLTLGNPIPVLSFAAIAVAVVVRRRATTTARPVREPRNVAV